MAIKYYVATNTGKGFITHLENAASHIAGHPADIYTTENTAWAARVSAVEKTKEEAQALVDAELSGSYHMGYDESSDSMVRAKDEDGNDVPIIYTLP